MPSLSGIVVLVLVGVISGSLFVWIFLLDAFDGDRQALEQHPFPHDDYDTQHQQERQQEVNSQPYESKAPPLSLSRTNESTVYVPTFGDLDDGPSGSLYAYNPWGTDSILNTRNAFCVAELPREFARDVEAKFSNGSVRAREAFGEMGFGKAIDPNDPTFRITNQVNNTVGHAIYLRLYSYVKFALETLFYYWMQNASNTLVSSSCDDAEFVFVPLLLVNEMVLNNSEGWDPGQLSRHFATNIRSLLPNIDTKPHLVVLGRVGFDFVRDCSRGLFSDIRPRWGNSLLCDVLHPNLWFVLIEQPPRRGIANYIIAPYPSRFHDVQLARFDDMQSQPARTVVAAHHVPKSHVRQNLVYATFIVRDPVRQFRERLANQCQTRAEQCVFYEKDTDQLQYMR
ncbi:hypothetical protein HK405_007860, partial [Cladochytrium tenue]